MDELQNTGPPEPVRRGRLLVHPVHTPGFPPCDSISILEDRVERMRGRRQRILDEALRLVSAGFKLALTDSLEGDGRKPQFKRWHLDPLSTEVGVRDALAHRRDSNLMVVTGPGMAPDGSWLVHLEADAAKDDPWGPSRALAEESLARFLAGVGEAPRWESRRGLHTLVSVPDKFGRAFHAELKSHSVPGFPGLDAIFGGFKPDGVRKATSAMVPPSETDGVERVWVFPTTVVARLPEHALNILATLAFGRVDEAEAVRQAWFAARAARRALRAVEDDEDVEEDETDAWHAFRRGTIIHDFEQIGPAISGRGGHDATFRAACSIVSGGVEDEEEQRELLQIFNDDYCSPPWSKDELTHKLEDANRVVGGDRAKETRLEKMFKRRYWTPWTLR
ncbi:bifunctional DNA primase/polymerase [Paludisphaera mucosa]|uniref:Bifunctional DNA primase/polymerase n=1 Tax=Paludisphaera mucosa TaxID=3030827 RepID=A0ABT6F5L0_9BACT|nr:bifunctional DNA primase/polymerase [Paludisphaera mucosa]MDG3002865.1 bifunctional DNA primase/polymerase [Paludisphaera mucosa]